MADPVFITLVLQFKPELADQICAGFPAVVEETRGFKGFRSLTMRRHADDPAKVVIVEEWDSRDDYQAYVDWRMAGDGAAAFAATLAAPPQLDYWPLRVV